MNNVYTKLLSFNATGLENCQQKNVSFLLIDIKNVTPLKTTILSELSLSELSTEKKRRGALVSFYIAALLVMTVAGIMMTIRKGTSIFTFLPIVFLPIFFSIYKGYDDVKKEIKSRNDT